MNSIHLQQWLDRLVLVSAQRWMFVAIAVSSVVAASTTTAVVGGGQAPIVLALLVGLAITAVIRPDSHTALFVEAIVVWQWLAVVDDATSPGAAVLALCLFVFHAVIALMAVTPSPAVVDHRIVRRWVLRGVGVGAATLAMWLVVVVMAQRDGPGSVTSATVALLALGALVVAVRMLSLPGHDR
jgi:hypothetical protein